MEFIFWSSILEIFYAYAGYPLALAGLSFFKNKPIQRKAIRPPVSLIVTAYNEAHRIKEKIQNCLDLNYHGAQFEIIVASDCSTDGTDEIVKSYAPQGIRLVRAPERQGKEAAQKYAVAASRGEILVFSDVATILRPNGIAKIVENFADPTVGCVSSEDQFIDADGKISGEGIYVQYEMFLRGLETKVNSLVGLSGSFFAARRQVCENWADNLQSDFNTLLNSIRLGLRGVSDPESVGYYKNIKDEKKEFDRKARTVLRGVSVFMRSLTLLNPIHYGIFSWQLFSHKLCRWLVPFAMLLALVSNMILASGSPFYFGILAAQSIFYSVAILGIKMRLLSKHAFFRLPAFFVTVNLSILVAWMRYVKGDRMVRWNPSQR